VESTLISAVNLRQVAFLRNFIKPTFYIGKRGVLTHLHNHKLKLGGIREAFFHPLCHVLLGKCGQWMGGRDAYWHPRMARVNDTLVALGYKEVRGHGVCRLMTVSARESLYL
jgi:hypothetical protein